MATKTIKHKNGKNGKRRGNHTGTLIKRGNTYLAQWSVRGPDGKRKRISKSTHCQTIEAAREFLENKLRGQSLDDEEKFVDKLLDAKKLIDVERREIVEQKAKEEDAKPALAISDGFAAFRESKRRKDCGSRTLDGYESQYDTFSTWIRGNYPSITELRKVTSAEADAFSTYLLNSKSANTHNKYITLLAYVWNVLRGNARITFNPWELIVKKTVSIHVRRELTVEELTRVCDNLEGEMRILFAIGIYTGLRLGDCATLKWGNADLVRGFISTSPRKTARHSNGKIVTIPLHPTLAGMLADIPTEKRRGFILPETAEIYERNPSVLTNRIQKHFRSCGIQTGGKTARLYKKRGTYRFELQELDTKGHHIIEDTKLTDLAAARDLFAKRFGSAKRDCVDVGFHSLRHTFVSLSANAGVPLAVVQAIVGHSNPVMTRHYFHASNEALKGAVAALPDVIDAEFKQVESAKPAENRSLSAIQKVLPDLTDAELTELEHLLRSEIERRRTSASVSH